MTTSGDEGKLAPERRTRALLFASHALGAAAAFWFAHLLRFEFRLPESRAWMVVGLLGPVIAIKLTALFLCGVHRIEWRYATLRDLRSIAVARILSTAFIALVDALV